MLCIKHTHMPYTMIVVLTVIALLSFTIHPSSSTTFNITEHSFNDNDPEASSDWHCWNTLFVNPLNNKHECNCFINVTCTNQPSLLINENNNNNHEFIDNSSLVWLRCYNLQSVDDSITLSQFHKTLPRKLLELVVAKDASRRCMPQQNDIVSSSLLLVPLRTDFIRCDQNIVNNFLGQLVQSGHYYWLLKSLTISESGLDKIPDNLPNHFKSLHTLNLTANQLTKFDSNDAIIDQSSSSSIETIDLSNNQLERVDLSHFTALRTINLSQNNLSTLSRNNLHAQTVDVNIGNNPWNCDHRIDWLIDMIAEIVEKNGRSYFFESTSNQLMNNVNNHVDLFQTNEPECNQPIEAKMFPFSVWKSVKESSICQTCNCYLKDKYAKVGYRYVSINCTNRNLVSLPSRLPKNTKILDLSANQIRNLNPLSKYHHGELSKWANINKIILSNNLLESLDGLESIRSIVFLDISGNLLTEIPYHIVNKVLSSNKIDKFRIGNNPYVCDCNTVKFQKWLHNNYRIILDIKQVRCGHLRDELLLHNQSFYVGGPMIQQARQSRFFNKEILQINSLHLCPIADTVVDALDLINIVLAVSIMLLIIKVGYDFLWQKRTGKLPRFFKLNI